MLQSLFSLIVLAEVSILGQTVWRQHTNIKWALIAHNLCRSLCSQCKSTAYSLRIPDHSKAFLAPYQRVPHNEECLKEIFNSGLKGLEFFVFFTLTLTVVGFLAKSKRNFVLFAHAAAPLKCICSEETTWFLLHLRNCHSATFLPHLFPPSVMWMFLFHY